ncbi:hypothetical protein PWT90_07261 [Aphanocladium album]|nr:hypothetical protein PWT90_07261 [Aphanocladium album]
MSANAGIDSKGAMALLSEVRANDFGAICGAVEFDVDDSVLDFLVASSIPRTTSFTSFFDAVKVADIAVYVGISFIIPRRIGYGNIGANFCAATGYLDADAVGTGGSRDNDDPVLQAEKFMETVGGRDSNRHIGKFCVSEVDDADTTLAYA